MPSTRFPVASEPNRAAAYFNRFAELGARAHAVVTQEYHPTHGWRTIRMRKRISASWAAKLRAQGITSVRLSSAGHLADFTTTELAKRPKRTR